MSDYYPEFYLRKRRKEQAYRRTTVVAVGFLILLAVFGVVGYIAFNAFATRRTPPGATPQLAEQQQQLQTAEQIASSSVPKDVLANTEQQPAVDLKGVNYSESFPQVDVKLEGAQAKPEGDATTAADPNAPADSSTEQPPAAGHDAANAPADQTATPSDNSAADNTAEAPKPSDQDTRVGSVTPSMDDDAKRKADQAKRQDQAKREAEKREAAKKADEKKKRDDQKKKLAEAEQAKDDAKDKDAKTKDDSVRAPATKSAGYSYTVYGGTYLSSEDAEKDRAKLGAIGLSGNVIHTAGDFLLMVGRLDDQDSAAALSGKLHSSGFGGAFVTRKAK